MKRLRSSGSIVKPRKRLETGIGTKSARIPYTLLLRIEAIGFPTFGLLLYEGSAQRFKKDPQGDRHEAYGSGYRIRLCRTLWFMFPPDKPPKP